MRSEILKSTVATSVAIAGLIAVCSSGGSADGAAAARTEASRKSERVPAHTCREKLVLTCDGKEVGFLASHGMKYVSRKYGWRQDVYNQWGQLLHQVYALRMEKASITVLPPLKQYRFNTLTEKQFTWLEMSPGAMIQQVTSGQCTELGRRTIDGIEAEGIEIEGDAKTMDMLNKMGFPIRVDIASIRLWTNPETSLPVRVEFRAMIREKYVTVWTGGKPVEAEVVDHEFRWKAELDRSIFEPNIPDDYTLIPEPSDSWDATQAITGLRTFALLTGGTYPSKLNMMTILREACQAIRLSASCQSDQELVRQEKVKRVVASTKPTCLFLCRLVVEGKDAAYYGDAVTAADAHSVLLRWRTGDDAYAVVFGDLTTECMPAKQLAELDRLSREASR